MMKNLMNQDEQTSIKKTKSMFELFRKPKLRILGCFFCFYNRKLVYSYQGVAGRRHANNHD